MMDDRTNWNITVLPASAISSQAWWQDLHSMIIASFQRKDIQAFPPTWTRLNADPAAGGAGLAAELSANGQLAVIFDEDGKPVACGGVLPFRGQDWIEDVQSTDSAAQNTATAKEEDNATRKWSISFLYPQAREAGQDWELCCVCVNPSHRGRGLSHLLLQTIEDIIKAKGGRRLIANYSLEETGDYWPRMRFNIPLGDVTVLNKGFTHTPGLEGLREDIHFKMMAKVLE
jgi:GNAT superfamily N-acetyltransferase